MRILTELKELCEQSVNLYKMELVNGLAGNVSIRLPNGKIAITPSSVSYETYSPEMMCIVDDDGTLIEGELAPSSETPMHVILYKAFMNINAIVHTHSPYAMIFAALSEPIAVIGLEGLGFGTQKIPCTNGLIMPGSKKLGQEVTHILRDNPDLKAVLLQNHGALVTGESLKQAVELARCLEFTAQVYYRARCIGKPMELTKEQIVSINEHYAKLKSKREV